MWKDDMAQVKYFYRYSSTAINRYNKPMFEDDAIFVRSTCNESHINDIIEKSAFWQCQRNRKNMMLADKVWQQIDDGPIKILKARDGNYDFDHNEFEKLLFLQKLST